MQESIRELECRVQSLLDQTTIPFPGLAAEDFVDEYAFDVLDLPTSFKNVTELCDMPTKSELKDCVEDKLSDFKFERGVECVNQTNSRFGGKLHNREIHCTITGDNGKDYSEIYFITGGVDFLMDVKQATSLFRVKK